MLYHVYASLDEAKQFLRDEGDAWGAGSTNDARALSLLFSVSRRVDDWCRRSAFGSGFGPRLGTNRYNASGGTSLDFRDDLIETTDTVVSRASTGSTTTSEPAADTDYYLVNQYGGYEPGPFRRADLHGEGDITRFGTGLRVVEWPGSWGYEDRTRTLVATASAVADTTTPTLTVSAADEFSPGQTLRIGTEQVYVEGVTDGETVTLTVVRGVNGTTAATHADNAAVELFLYDSRVVDATLRLFVRRWRGRTAGSDGMDGNSDLGMVVAKESEDTILRRSLSELRLMGSVVF